MITKIEVHQKNPKLTLQVTNYSPNIQHIANSLVNGGRGPSAELCDVKQCITNKDCREVGLFLTKMQP